MTNDRKEKVLAVIVGRFQAHTMHEGYEEILQHAAAHYDNVAVIFGESYRKYTKQNPLPTRLRQMLYCEGFTARRLMTSGKLIIGVQYDHKSDVIWSKNLDSIVDGFMSQTGCTDMRFIIGRDSFDKYYNGKYINQFVKYYSEEVAELSSTVVRDSVKDLGEALSKVAMNDDFAAGVIHAIQNQYPRVDPTVDIVPVFEKEGLPYAVVSRKSTDEVGKFRFFGGYVDVTDNSLEAAAIRELEEESGFKAMRLEHLGSSKIHDWRYRDGKDGIMTTFFKANIRDKDAETMEAKDDLAGQQVAYVLIDNLHDVIVPEHKPLVEILQKVYKEKLYANN